MNVVIIGPHGVGKSTLGAALAAELGLPFHTEIGWELARDRSFRPSDITAERRQDRFDEEVFRRELDRDRTAPSSRIIETWHPGNLAYAAHRSPDVVKRFLPEIERACRRTPTLVIPLSAPREVLASRKHEPGNLDFFIKVGRHAVLWAKKLGLLIAPTVVTADCNIQGTLDVAISLIKGFVRDQPSLSSMEQGIGDCHD